MGEPHRSPQISLSPQQLQEGSIYLRQVSLGLAALTQMKSENLATTMATLQAELSSEIPDPHPQNANSRMDSGMDSGMNLGININNINSSGIDINFSQLSDRLLSPIQNNPLDNSLTFPELAFGVQVLIHLCQQHQELIRRAVSLMEQITKEGKDPWQVTLLKDYSQRLSVSYSLHRPPHLTAVESPNQWRGKILFDLLFYSSSYGQQRLWLRCTQPVNISRT